MDEYLVKTLPWTVIHLSGPLFFVLLLIKAPYGRYSSKNAKFCLNPKVAWLLMESMTFISIPVFFLGAPTHTNWWIHYANRALVFPCLMKGRTPMHCGIFLLSCVWCLYNGIIISRHFGCYSKIYTAQWLLRPNYIVGIVLFFLGMYCNIKSDSTLRNLRKSHTDPDYSIPCGGLFEYVSCPNYLGEILEWTGMALATFSLPYTSFAIFTAANLVPRAIFHHQWYRNTFGKHYPQNRKIIIPYIF